MQRLLHAVCCVQPPLHAVYVMCSLSCMQYVLCAASLTWSVYYVQPLLDAVYVMCSL